eukprot:329259-Chlamydomonas_euryale.AAC.10
MASQASSMQTSTSTPYGGSGKPWGGIYSCNFTWGGEGSVSNTHREIVGLPRAQRRDCLPIQLH